MSSLRKVQSRTPAVYTVFRIYERKGVAGLYLSSASNMLRSSYKSSVQNKDIAQSADVEKDDYGREGLMQGSGGQGLAYMRAIDQPSLFLSA